MGWQKEAQSLTNQNRVLQDAKISTHPPWTKSLTNAIITMVLHKYDVTLTISLTFPLRVAKPL